MVLQWFTDAIDRTETQVAVYSTAIIAVVIAAVLVFMASHEVTITSILVTVLIASLVFLLMTSATGIDAAGSLPSVTYPRPPHLGLGQVSLQNWWPGQLPHNPQLN